MEPPSIKIFLNLNDSKKNQGNAVSRASTTRPNLRPNATTNDRPNLRATATTTDRPNTANNKRPSTAQGRSEDRFNVNMNKKINVGNVSKTQKNHALEDVSKTTKTNHNGGGT